MARQLYSAAFGLTLGKFLPFHKGHELLLDVAAASCDYLYVLIGSTSEDFISSDLRKKWIEEYLSKRENRKPFKVLIQEEESKKYDKDSQGTILDEDYWQEWIKSTQRLLGWDHKNICRVFTSDAYGERIAKEFEATWYPVDPNREMVKISGTKIRENWCENFHYISNTAKRDLVKTYALVGPESTGKSTATKRLAELFEAPYALEYGRTAGIHRNFKFSKEDFFVILNAQQALIDSLAVKSNGVIFTDTEALTTFKFYREFFGDEPPLEWHRFVEDQKITRYFILQPNVPFIQDGTRKRKSISEGDKEVVELMKRLNELRRRFDYITDKEYDHRISRMARLVEKDMLKLCL